MRGDFIKEKRKRMGLSQLAVYEETGVQPRIQSDIENNRRSNFVIDNIARLADFYGVTTDFLIGRGSDGQDSE